MNPIIQMMTPKTTMRVKRALGKNSRGMIYVLCAVLLRVFIQIFCQAVQQEGSCETEGVSIIFFLSISYEVYLSRALKKVGAGLKKVGSKVGEGVKKLHSKMKKGRYVRKEIILAEATISWCIGWFITQKNTFS